MQHPLKYVDVTEDRRTSCTTHPQIVVLASLLITYPRPVIPSASCEPRGSSSSEWDDSDSSSTNTLAKDDNDEEYGEDDDEEDRGDIDGGSVSDESASATDKVRTVSRLHLPRIARMVDRATECRKIVRNTKETI